MKHQTDIKSLTVAALLGAVILAVSGTAGCSTSRRTTTAKPVTDPAMASSHHSEAVQQPRLDATQTCRATLHHIEGAKRVWALENRKPDSATPTDADLFGASATLREKPKCPSGGTYTLRAVEEPPLCSIPGHVY